MSFNTAIFYDIENLLKGYSFSQQIANNLSLKDILRELRRTEQTGQIAVQRAYANWSDPRLAIMRGEINELGIDPIQVFGFSRDQKKNAADIQLAIDAIDLAHVRPTISVYVIVSGDGGFASLAKKLHEYGKMVIGVAYRDAANRTFQSVCDEFLFIPDPEDDAEVEKPAPRPVAHPGGNGHPLVTDPRNLRMKAKVRPAATPEDAVTKARELLHFYLADAACRSDLAQSGIYLNVVQEGVRYAVPGFQVIRFGFTKFSEFLQHACAGTPVCVVRPPNSQAVVMFRDKVRAGQETLPDLEVRELHSPDGYRALLAYGPPVFHLPAAHDLLAVLRWVAENPPLQFDLGSIVEAVTTASDGAISSQSAKHVVLSLVTADAFLRVPETSSLAEQVLTLKEELRWIDPLTAALRAAAVQKLSSLFPVREEIVGQMFGAAA